jgi:1-acyl-sn-glycerol-3-phosphate acyltransferase
MTEQQTTQGERPNTDARFRELSLFDKLVYWITVSTCLVIYTILFRVSRKGTHLVPKKGPVMVICNHVSHLDPPLVAISLPRRLTFLAKQELFDHWFMGPYLTSLGVFPIKRGSSDRASIRHALSLLRNGNVLVMFPEGTRSSDGELKPPKSGVAMMVNQMPEITIVPARISGTFQAFGPGRSFPSPKKVSIHYGEPFSLADLGTLPTVKKELYQKLGEEFMARIAACGPQTK